MPLTREHLLHLQAELNAGHDLSMGDYADIQGAFEELDPTTLRDRPENAMASDMLEELLDATPVAEFGWYGWEAEPDMTGDGSGDPDKYFITITKGGEEYALIVHRTVGGKYPLDGDVAIQKTYQAEHIVNALNNAEKENR